MKNYTIVGLCLCGCEDTFIAWEESVTPEGAALKVALKREAALNPSKIIAIFEGSHKDLSPNRVRIS
jgi:hypothetical protein